MGRHSKCHKSRESNCGKIIVKCNDCPKPTPVDQCKLAKVAFIDEAGSGLSATQSTIQLAFDLKLFPNIEAIAFRYYTAYNGNNLDQVVNELEANVNALKALGFNYFAFGGRSVFIKQWIKGTAGSLNGQTLGQRHATVIFVLTNLKTIAANEIGAVNVWKLIDTFNYGDLITQNINAFVASGASIIAVYQANDTASSENIQEYKDAAAVLGITVVDAQLILNQTDPAKPVFTPVSLNAALITINAAPIGSLAIYAVNGSFSIAEALASQFNWTGITNKIITNLDVNFSPVKTTLPINLNKGISKQAPIFLAPLYYKCLGLPTDPNVSSDIQTGYVEAMAFASVNVVGEAFHGNDGLSRFGADKTIISPFIGSSSILANTLATNPSLPFDWVENSRWTAAHDVYGPKLGCC